MIDEISTHSAVNFQALFIRWSVVNVLFKTTLDCFFASGSQNNYDELYRRDANLAL